MKTVLITGANRGIGFETARQLGRLGFYIFLAARDDEKGKKAIDQLKKQNSDGMFVQIDVSNKESIQRAFEIVKNKTKKLDVLINNAGLSLKEDRNILNIDVKDINKLFSTNAIGPLLVIQIFNPLLKNGSRIINVSSGGGSMSDPVEGWSPVYCVTKSTLNSITRQIAFVMGYSNIAVNSVCPGWVKTDMGGRGASRPVEKGAESIVWLATEAPIKLTGKFIRDKKVIPW
ncbi:MAG TPA: SDR family NAD(P)-dependent oxidoreductase [Ignavibacteria bacterium]|jgi:NAD(P)-dependent dehydrogenase (short-subunit alcohol dehydrogenase family)